MFVCFVQSLSCLHETSLIVICIFLAYFNILTFNILFSPSQETMEVNSANPTLAAVTPSAVNTLPSTDNPEMVLMQRSLGFGSLFGEVSLITDSPYVSTTTALG